MPQPRYTMHVLSHTHWDREWYQEFQGYRQRLVFQLDSLLDLLDREPRYRAFHLDGQTSPVQDYLELRPAQRPRLTRRLQEGRIFIGPWFTMPDEFIVSGESLVRNLLLGRRICAEFGVAPTPIGYVTDSFGHCSQLPQILRGFGLQAAILHYGTSGDSERSEMVWEGADGSEVLLIKVYVYTGYNDFWEFARQPDAKQVREFERSKHRLATTPVLFGLDGGDHQPAWPETPQRITYLNGIFRQTRCIHSTWPQYLRALWRHLGPHWQRGRIRFRGELRSPAKVGRYNAVHQGTGSSRLPLKQVNDAQEWLLARVAEPLHAWAVLLGGDNQQSFLHLAWRYLMLNHPHDSIVGCCIDQAHRDMMYRFDQSRLLAVNSIRESYQAIGDRINTAALSTEARTRAVTVFNAAAAASGPVSHFSFDVASGDVPAGQVPVLADAQGQRSAVQVLKVQEQVRVAAYTRKRADPGKTDYSYAWPDNGPFDRYEVAAAGDVPALGYKTWRLEWVPQGKRPLPAGLTPVRAQARPPVLENEHLRVVFCRDGRFDLLDKAAGRCYRGLGTLENVGDAGTGWNYQEPARDQRILSTQRRHRGPVSLRVVERGPLRASVRVSFTLRIPRELVPDEEHRFRPSAKTARSTTLVALPVQTDYFLSAGARRLECRTRVRNQARCHRLRVLFPTALRCDGWYGDSPFDVVRRPVQLPDTTGWNERAREHHPIRNFVAACDPRRGAARGLAVLTKGVCEACVRDTPRREIALTLFRSFSQQLLFERTHESQLLQDLVMEYALLPFAAQDGAPPLEVLAEVDRYKVPLITHSRPVRAGALPLQDTLFEVDPPAAVSTIKLSEDAQAVVLRLFNPTARAAQVQVRARFPHGAIRLLNLAEEPLRRLDEARRENGAVALQVRPREILTLAFARRP